MAQGVGYLVAAIGPLTLGVLHDATGGWTVPLALLAALMAPQLVLGMGASRDLRVGRA
jgi:CP family cyanate transporter-like MFS transporter